MNRLIDGSTLLYGEAEDIRKLLSRYSLPKLILYAQSLSIASPELLTKKSVIEALLGHPVLARGFTYAHYASLDFASIISTAVRSLWTAYEFPSISATDFKTVFDRFSTSVCPFFSVHTDYVTRDLTLNSRSQKHSICLIRLFLPALQHACYICMPQRSRVFFLHNVKTEHVQFLLTALQSALQSPSKATARQLKGKHLESLIDLALHQNAQGQVANLTSGSAVLSKLPQNVVSLKRRTPEEGAAASGIVLNLDEHEETKRRKVLDDTYSCQSAKLEQLELRLPDGVVIELSGPSVFEGVEQMVAEGLLDVPLDPTWRNIRDHASNIVQAHAPSDQEEEAATE